MCDERLLNQHHTPAALGLVNAPRDHARKGGTISHTISGLSPQVRKSFVNMSVIYGERALEESSFFHT